MKKTVEEINLKIKEGKAVVLTAEEINTYVCENGIKKTLENVDVVTTATFGPMCSSGAFINFGHTNPPIKMNNVLLNGVPAYSGIAAVDAYIGATETSSSKGDEYGGAHVIEDLIAGKDVYLEAKGACTDCYPKKEIKTYINKNNLNQAYMFNPRNAYQNYVAAINSSDKTLFTYMGTLLPKMGNVNYSTSGELSPLLNDPNLSTIGIGTKMFLGGADGYVAWEGTQHNPEQRRGENSVPIGPAGTLSLIGNIKEMNARYIRAGVFEKYGITLYVGIGIPIPILNEEILKGVCVKNSEIFTNIIDYSVSDGARPVIKTVSYQDLQSGYVEIEGKSVRTSSLSSLKMAREIADVLKERISNGVFELTNSISKLPTQNKISKLEERGVK